MHTASVAEVAASQLGRNPQHVTHVRTGTNALYRCEDLAVRVASPGYDPQSLQQQLDLVHHLRQQDFPTPQPVGDMVAIDDCLVTSWEWIDTDLDIDPYEVGQLARQFHESTKNYRGEAGPWNPLHRGRTRMAAATLDDADRGVMERQLEDLSNKLQQVEGVPFGIVHGDLHDGNVIASHRGLQLLDFERFSHGPLEWDLAQRAVGARYFAEGSPSAWNAFQDGYGHLELSPLFEHLVLVRAFIMTTWLVSLPQSAQVDRERDIRLQFWRCRDAGIDTTEAGLWSPL